MCGYYFSANTQDGLNICQEHTAHKKTVSFNSGIDNKGEPKSQDRNGYRRTHDINKSVIGAWRNIGSLKILT
jgi:hypothetical protein